MSDPREALVRRTLHFPAAGRLSAAQARMVATAVAQLEETATGPRLALRAEPAGRTADAPSPLRKVYEPGPPADGPLAVTLPWAVLDGEEWRPVEGVPYEVSSCGRVRRVGKAEPLKQSYTSHGYACVRLSAGSRDQVRTAAVHVLVAAAFLGPRPAGLVLNHKSGDRRDNRPANLEYVTQAENVAHAAATGLLTVGEARANVVLSDDAVRAIRRLAAERGWGWRRVARATGHNPRTVKDVLAGRTWRHVTTAAAPANEALRLTLPWQVLVSDNERKGLMYVNGSPRVALTRECRRRIEAARTLIARQAGARPLFTTPVRVVARFVEPGGRRVDPTNYAKHLHDCLTGLVYADDSLIDDARQLRAGVDEAEPRVELEIAAIEPPTAPTPEER